MDLLACKDRCLMTKGCTAINFNSKTGGCSVRACDFPIPDGLDGFSDWVGYYYEPGIHSLELHFKDELIRHIDIHSIRKY